MGGERAALARWRLLRGRCTGADVPGFTTAAPDAADFFLAFAA